MTQKERKLGIVAGGLFGAFLLYMIVQRLLLGSIFTLRTEISDRQARLANLQLQARIESANRTHWTQLSARTLSNDKEVAAGKLDELIKGLLSQAGLQRFTVNPGEIKPSKDKHAGVSDYAVVPYTVVGAEGDMRAFVRFLYNFYQQPYAMQITGFNLEPVSFRRGNTLRVSSLVIETLLLPNEGSAPSHAATTHPTATHPTTTRAGAPVLAGAPATQPGRSKASGLDAYAILWDKKFMEPYSPPSAVAMPTFSPNGGNFNGPTNVTITTSTPSATIRYTTDGTSPSATVGKIYSAPVRLESPGTVKAIAIIEKRTSPLASVTFMEPAVPMPTISPSGGNYTGPMNVTISTSVAGATIRYTTDGTSPSATVGKVYNAPVRLESAGAVKAITIAEDKRTSSIATAAFTVPPPPPMKVVMLDDYGDVHEAVLVNEQTKQRQIVKEGDPFDGGRLVLVLPEAAIAQANDGQLYVYWLGKAFRDKEILSKARQPELYKEVKDQVTFE